VTGADVDVVVAILQRAGITPNRFLALMDE
jgi:hypothetical protein